MPEPRESRLLVVAIGGNALREAGGVAAPGEWFLALERTLPPLVDLVAEGFRLILTHGNGPQVGDELLRMELARKMIPPLSLDLCGAETQGSLGYAIQQVFGNLCRARGLDVPVATIVTRVVVDPKDPAFARPTKPIGPFYTAAQRSQLERQEGWALVEDAGRGFRRVVPSPRPLRVLEAEMVRRLSEAGAVPIACGGGGVPVVDSPAGYRGVEAVIEKDLATETLATALRAERLLILTAVERVAVNFGRPTERGLDRLTAAEARRLLAAGEFPPGSMGPKVEASVRFVEGGGREAIITSLDRVQTAIDGTAGTHIVS
ncbi:MAG: carbamate kinase [Candidatus Rokubacteria bacterium]|nr:carbamate kinase [Candidatus Rokubacteria bacterium]